MPIDLNNESRIHFNIHQDSNDNHNFINDAISRILERWDDLVNFFKKEKDGKDIFDSLEEEESKIYLQFLGIFWLKRMILTNFFKSMMVL